ncbi:hypothetical protein H4Q26_000536 [Puccinia striiformis f. sp. tritici PST-130]|nr:hypothetical protein H4Q26_000536 [Puccinia striiformis f. sp. tritici PST-130]
MASLTDLQTASLEVDLLQGMNIGKPAPPSATRISSGNFWSTSTSPSTFPKHFERIQYSFFGCIRDPTRSQQYPSPFFNPTQSSHCPQIPTVWSKEDRSGRHSSGWIFCRLYSGDSCSSWTESLGPKLEDSPLSLYNEACRQVALKTFSQAASTFAYAYLKINDEYTKDVELLIPAYNHYVHHLKEKDMKRKKKKKAWESKGVKFVRTRKQLRDSRVKFASDHKLPQRYRRIVSDINSHTNATKFFRRLDKLMLEDDQVNNRKPRRKRLFMKTGPAPSSERLQEDILLTSMILIDASKSLIRRNAPLENLTDKEFSDQFFTQLTAPYDLTHVIKDPAEDDNDSEEDNGNSEEYIDDLEEDNDDSEEDNDDSEEDNDEHFEDADTIHPLKIYPDRIPFFWNRHAATFICLHRFNIWTLLLLARMVITGNADNNRHTVTIITGSTPDAWGALNQSLPLLSVV